MLQLCRLLQLVGPWVVPAWPAWLEDIAEDTSAAGISPISSDCSHCACALKALRLISWHVKAHVLPE